MGVIDLPSVALNNWVVDRKVGRRKKISTTIVDGDIAASFTEGCHTGKFIINPSVQIFNHRRQDMIFVDTLITLEYDPRCIQLADF